MNIIALNSFLCSRASAGGRKERGKTRRCSFVDALSRAARRNVTSAGGDFVFAARGEDRFAFCAMNFQRTDLATFF